MNTTKVNASELISLAQLMPINCTDTFDTKLMQGHLSNYQGFIRLARNAVSSFLEGHFPDPLVGENACQIRAALFCEMAQNQEVVIELTKLAKRLEQGDFDPAKVSLGSKKRSSVKEIVDANQLDVKVPSIAVPVLFGYILTKTKLSDLSIKAKDVILKESNQPEELRGLSINFAKKLISEGRKLLSAGSIDYLRHEVQLLPVAKSKESLSQLLESGYLLKDALGLHSFPMLEGIQILLGSMKVHKTAIVLKDRIFNSGKELGTVTLLFEPTGREGAYQVVNDLTQVDQDRPGFIIEAVSISDQPHDRMKLTSSLIETGIEKIILANGAAHGQYGGSMKDKEPPVSSERESLKEHAFKSGLCADNPELCRIYHIFAGTLKRHLNLILSTYVFPGAHEFVKQNSKQEVHV